MLWRIRQFLKNFISATWNCVSEDLDVFPLAVLVTIFAGLIWLA